MSHIPDHVEHPDGWLRGKEARIKANANLTRRRKLVAAMDAAGDSEEFRAWLFETTPDALEALRVASQNAFDQLGDSDESNAIQAKYQRAWKAWRARVGNVPEALREAITKWNGLTEKQLAWARDAFKRNVDRAEGRDAKETARKASAPSLTPGRQFVVGSIQSARLEEQSFGVGRWASTTTSCKALILLDDGRKLWTSLPRDLWGASDIAQLKGTRSEITVTIFVSDDDTTMAFGKRPTSGNTTKQPKQPKTPRAKTSKPARAASQSAVETTNDAPATETKQQAKARRARDRRAKRNAASKKLDTDPQM